MKNNEAKYILELSEEQANMVSLACEFYARMRCGQWQELVSMCMWEKLCLEEFIPTRDLAEKKVLEARQVIFPELSKSFGHSYGVGKFEDSDLAWDIHQVVRNKIAWHNHPEGGITVDFQPPMSFSGKPLAKCEVKHEKD